MQRRFGAVIGALLLTLTLAGSVSAGDSAAAGPNRLPELAADKARVVFLRQGSVFQAGKPVMLEINGADVAKLRNRDYTYFDLPAGEHFVVVSAFPHTGAFRTGLSLKARQVRFLLVRPNTRQDDRRRLFRDSRRFDVDGGLFDVQEVGAKDGEEYRAAMRYEMPLAPVPALSGRGG